MSRCQHQIRVLEDVELKERVVVLTPFEPSNIGGVERLVREFSKRLSKEYDIRVICSGPSKYEYSNCVRTTVVKGYPFPHSLAPGLAPGLYGAVKAADPTIIYAHVYTSYVSYIVWKMKRYNRKVKVVFHTHYHDTGANFFNSIVRKFYDRTLGPRFLEQADVIIANSNSELRELRRDFGKDIPAFVVHGGVDVSNIRAADRFELEKSIIPLLWVGRLETYKNPYFALETIAQLPEYFHLFVIGDGPERGGLESAVKRLGAEGRVHFLGKVSNHDLYSWYKTAHAFLNFSSSESFGLTCIESLAAGTPVVANQDGHGLSETISRFPNYVRGCDVRRDTPKNVAALVEETCLLKPVSVDINEFDWNALADAVSDILSGRISTNVQVKALAPA